MPDPWPYGCHGIAETDARNSVQVLVAAVQAADELNTHIERHHAVDTAIRQFRDSAYGRVALDLVNKQGKVLVPLFSTDQVADKTRRMLSRVEEGLLVKNNDGELVVSDNALKNEPRIKSEPRLMINPEKLGREFVGFATEAAVTLSSVLLALAYGAYEHADAENVRVLLNNDQVARQILHRDLSGQDIEARMAGKGCGSRGRPQPPPFSALCAFQDATTLHCINGSHLNPLQTSFRADQVEEVSIPTGSACLFHPALVHGGMGSVGLYHARLHMFLKATGCSQAYGGKIQVVTCDRDTNT